MPITVNDILEKIEKLDKIQSSLKDIYHHGSEIGASELETIYDAYDVIEEYIGELKKKEVKE